MAINVFIYLHPRHCHCPRCYSVNYDDKDNEDEDEEDTYDTSSVEGREYHQLKSGGRSIPRRSTGSFSQGALFPEASVRWKADCLVHHFNYTRNEIHHWRSQFSWSQQQYHLIYSLPPLPQQKLTHPLIAHFIVQRCCVNRWTTWDWKQHQQFVYLPRWQRLALRADKWVI